MEHVVVIGAGLAGLRTCEGLRARGYAGPITLAGEEARVPYDRPPLSKQFLAGAFGHDRVTLRREDELTELDLDLRLGASSRATSLDVAARRVQLASGESLEFDGLVIATGSRARLLPGLEALSKVHVLRTLDDSVALGAGLGPGRRLLVVGGGFVGMEVAATARGLGTEVTVVEPLETPLERVLGRLAGGACARLHAEHGVRLETGTTIEEAVAEPDGTTSALLARGGVVAADVVLVAVGATPNVSWLEGSGLEAGPGGLVCDATLQVAPGIVAAGDVARFPFGPAGSPVRVEHRTNAAEQGDHAAGTLLGGSEPFAPVPYVWSDQYEVKIQLLGLPEPDDVCEVVDGSLRDGRFVAAYGREGRLTAAVAFQMPRSLMRLRAMLATPTPYERARRAFV